MNKPDNIDRDAITAVVLAGGQSTRMHAVDKALLRWRERYFIEHIVERLRTQVERIAINTNSADEPFKSFNLPLLPEPFPDRRGPLAGILAALNYSTTAFTLIVPCDNPLLADELAARLAAALRANNAAIAYAACGADHYYLYALLRSDLRDSVDRFLRNGDSAVRRWYASEHAVAVDFSDVADRFRNINTPTDLHNLPQ